MRSAGSIARRKCQYLRRAAPAQHQGLQPPPQAGVLHKNIDLKQPRWFSASANRMSVPSTSVLEEAARSVAALEAEMEELTQLAGAVGHSQDSSHQITDVALKKRLRACGIVDFENVHDVLKRLQAGLKSVDKQMSNAMWERLDVAEKEETSEAKEERMNELAQYKLKFRENKTLAMTPYRGAEEAKADVMPYIRGALGIGTKGDDEVAWWRVSDKSEMYAFGTIGRMGTGKTRLQYELCKQEAVQTDFGSTHVNFVRLAYNEGSQDRALPGWNTIVFGQNLLMSTGMSRADAQRVLSLEEAVELLYRKLLWPPGKEQALVVCVDDLLHLPAGKDSERHERDGAGLLLRRLMWFQKSSLRAYSNPDETSTAALTSAASLPGTNRVVFLFAAAPGEQMGLASEGEYRLGFPSHMRDVPTIGKEDALSMLFDLRPDLRARYRDDAQFELLVHLCLAKPRALFHGILDAYPEGVESVDMTSALNKVAESCSLGEALQYLGEEDVRAFLSCRSVRSCKELIHGRSLWLWGVKAADGSLDPLVLRVWCEVWSKKKWEGIRKEGKALAVARYLREAYVADAKVEESHEKVAEEVLYNFEAAKRASYDGPFRLSEYYRGGTVKGDLRKGDLWESVCAFPGAAPEDLVQTVATFKKKRDVFELLKKGCVVVSTSATASGYLVPFFDPASRELTYVAAVQVKLKICDAVMELPIVKHLEQSGVTCFPVYVSMSPGDVPKKAGKVKRSVLYNEAAMLEFTECLGPLRLHRELVRGNEAEGERSQSVADTEAPKAKKARTE